MQLSRLKSVRPLAGAYRSDRFVCGAGAVFAVVARPNFHALQGILPPFSASFPSSRSRVRDPFAAFRTEAAFGSLKQNVRPVPGK
jgi:hypothetical protein